MRAATLLLAVVLFAAPAAGCLGFLKKDDGPAIDPNANAKKIDNGTLQKIESRISAVPKNYTFAGQRALPATTIYINDTMDSSSNTGFEDRSDRSGSRYNVVRRMTDVASLVPEGQPTELRITLFFQNGPANAIDCDIAVDVPGTTTSWNGASSDQFNWKVTVQRMIVNTVGVAGAKHEVGVECANGMSTQGVAYSIRVDAHYAKDVFAPAVPYAFQVPANASGVILESEKAGGPEHLQAWFMIVGPNDDLVQFVDFNDIAIPTESVFVPVNEPGEYVFYAFNMTGGFLSIRSDVPVDDRAVRALSLVRTVVVDQTGPAPGLASRNWMHDGLLVTPDAPAGGMEVTFDAGATFPLRIEAFIGDPASGGNTAFSDVKISSAKGLVASLQRVLRHDDGSGSLGVSQDHYNSAFLPMNLARGTYKVQISHNSPDAPVGHVLTTYAR